MRTLRQLVGRSLPLLESLLLYDGTSSVPSAFSGLVSTDSADAQDSADTLRELRENLLFGAEGVHRRILLARETRNASVQVKLSSDDSADVVLALIGRESELAPECLHALLVHPAKSIRARIAAWFRLSTELEQVALSDSSIREYLSVNQWLSNDAVRILAADRNPLVRAALTAARRLPAMIQLKLARDPLYEVRASLARRPELAVRAAKTLARDADERVRIKLALNLSVSDEVLSLLSRDSPALKEALKQRTALNKAKAKGKEHGDAQVALASFAAYLKLNSHAHTTAAASTNSNHDRVRQRLDIDVELEVAEPELIGRLIAALDRVHRAYGGAGLEIGDIEVGAAVAERQGVLA